MKNPTVCLHVHSNPQSQPKFVFFHRELWYENQDVFANQAISDYRLLDVAVMLNVTKLALGFDTTPLSLVAGMLQMRLVFGSWL
jgi:hypothetical protein